MPFYEYRCDNCEYQLEALQKISDSPLVDCPQCGQPSLKKLVSAAAFRLKGSGWYETDFKKSGKKNLHESAGKEAASKETGGKASGKEAAAKEGGSGGAAMGAAVKGGAEKSGADKGGVQPAAAAPTTASK
jgi:putative FmdB family regulatory protein